jgi:hypothetical protein
VKFHVTFRVRDAFPLSEIGTVQKRIGEAVQRIMQTGKVKDSGVMIGDRMGYFVLEANSAEELFSWFAPLYDVAVPDIQPVVSFEVLPKLFEDLAKFPH